MIPLPLAPPSPELLARGTPFVRLLAEAAAALGGTLEMEADYGFVGRFRDRHGSTRAIFGKSLGLNRDSAAALAADKDYTARLLAAEGLPSPDGQLVFSETYRARMALKNRDVAARLPGVPAARRFAEATGYPVIVKPNCGSEGRDIRRAQSPEELDTDLADAFRTDERIRVETFLPGRDYRFLVLDGTVRLAYERRPFSVTGDGRSPIRALLGEALDCLSETHRGAKLSPDDARILRGLADQGLTLESIPAPGLRVRILGNANLSTGGTLHDLGPDVHADAASLAVRAASALGLTVAGVDIIAPDLAQGTDGAVILEVNSAPGLDYYASTSPAHWSQALAVVTDMLDRP